MQLKVRVLSEIKGEESLDIVGDIMAPIVEISSDESIKKTFTAKGGNVAKAVRQAIKGHKDAIFELLTSLNIDVETGKRVTKKEYVENCTPVLIMNQLTTVLMDPPVRDLFFSQGQTKAKTSSGSVMENTEAEEN